MLDGKNIIIYDNSMDLSQQLKHYRLLRGLSLAQAARRADTSAATLCRYENGWQRFELYTLRKLAGALGCRLKVELVPIESDRHDAARRFAFRRLGRLFWDRRLRKRDLEDYPLWVIERVLEYGSLQDVRCLVEMMGKETFLQRVALIRFKSAKTQSFWLEMLKREGLHARQGAPEREQGASGRAGTP